MIWVAKSCVVIKSNFAIKSDDSSIRSFDEWINFNQRCIRALECLPQRDENVRNIFLYIRWESTFANNVQSLLCRDTLVGVNMNFG